MIRAYMVFSGTGPILVLTRSADGMQSERAKTYFSEKGIDKYIAIEVSAEHAEKKYGTRFHTTAAWLQSEEDIRVLDIEGHHVFYNFEYEEMGEPVYV
ncbi:MAG: hypothetical protein HQL76_10705 [Magnetococcales bacterium]|nr:hypothetical protein [Magnetococcales bacterium]